MIGAIIPLHFRIVVFGWCAIIVGCIFLLICYFAFLSVSKRIILGGFNFDSATILSNEKCVCEKISKISKISKIKENCFCVCMLKLAKHEKTAEVSIGPKKIENFLFGVPLHEKFTQNTLKRTKFPSKHQEKLTFNWPSSQQVSWG